MQTLPFADQVHVPTVTLASWPLPAAIVRHGRPQASGAVLDKSADGRIVRGIWACTPGEFAWRWDYDETVMVVQGRATVTMGDGRRVELAPGTLAFFERGQDSVWTIHEDFRKAFHADSPTPLPF
jgi:uncharacterized cupin superfamily protein